LSTTITRVDGWVGGWLDVSLERPNQVLWDGCTLAFAQAHTHRGPHTCTHMHACSWPCILRGHACRHMLLGTITHTHTGIHAYMWGAYIHTVGYASRQTYLYGVHTQTYWHTCIHSTTHTVMHTYMQRGMRTCIHTCIHTYMHTLKHKHTCMHACIHTRTYTQTGSHTYTHTCIHTGRQSYTHVHIHTHRHTHIYIIHIRTYPYTQAVRQTHREAGDHTYMQSCIHA